jgi:hypothetical protein
MVLSLHNGPTIKILSSLIQPGFSPFLTLLVLSAPVARAAVIVVL